MAELLIGKAREAIRRVDLSQGKDLLSSDYGLRSLAGWVKNKFGVTIQIDEIRNMEPDELKNRVCQLAESAYDGKESEYPVMAGLYRFAGTGGQGGIDRPALVSWARERFDVDLSLEDLKNKQRGEIRELLVSHSCHAQQLANEALAAVKEKVDQLFASTGGTTPAVRASGGNGALDSLTSWVNEKLKCEITTEEIAKLKRDELEQKLNNAVEDRYRPEMRRMERALLLQLVDTAWKDHLLVMDHLRASVGLKGWAQMDPKVEYKREGMRLFEQMWEAIDERATDLLFRMEQLDEEFVGSTWVETSARHDDAESASDIAQQQQEAIDASQGDRRVDPIRNRGKRVGRNEPCPCGSGKKYKVCCMRKGS